MKVIIIGAGSTAATVAEILKQNRVFETVGYIDERPGEKVIDTLKVIGDDSIIEELYSKGIHNAIVAISDNKIRERIYLRLKNIGFNFINAIHSTAIISPSVTIGEGVIIEAGVNLLGNTSIGNNVIIAAGSIIGRNSIINHNVFIGPGVVAAGENVIKKNAFISCGVSITNHIIIGKNIKVKVGASVDSNIEDLPLN